MQPSTPISAYKHSEENQSPTVPSVLRSKHKPKISENDPIRRVRQLVTHPTEIIIDAHRYNQQHGSVLPRKQEGIRGEIDACLSAVEKVYQQQAKRRSTKGILTEVSAGEPVISGNSIHRVDTNLILKYIGTIRQDYNLPNSFGEIRKNLIYSRSPNTLEATRNPEERFTSAEKRPSSKKSFINMTLSTNREKRGDSRAKPANSPANRGKSPSTIHSPGMHEMPSNPITASPQKKPVSYRIPQEFKYCISCEQSVLSSNINYHEQNECKQLQQLYRLSFAELKQYIGQKITIFRRNLHEKLDQLRKDKKSGEEHCEQVMSSIQKYLQELQGDDETRELSFLQVRGNYLKFQESLRGDFFDCISLTQKLDYFIKVYVQLTRSGTVSQGILNPSAEPPKVCQGEERVASEEGMTVPVSHFQASQH